MRLGLQLEQMWLRVAPLCFLHLGWRCRRPTVQSHQPSGRCQRNPPSCRGKCCCIQLHSGCAAAARCESGNGTGSEQKQKQHILPVSHQINESFSNMYYHFFILEPTGRANFMLEWTGLCYFPERRY